MYNNYESSSGITARPEVAYLRQIVNERMEDLLGRLVGVRRRISHFRDVSFRQDLVKTIKEKKRRIKAFSQLDLLSFVQLHRLAREFQYIYVRVD